MKKYQTPFGLCLALLILLTGFKKDAQHQSFLSAKSLNTISGRHSSTEQPEIIIPSEITVIQSDKGQKPAEIMVCLSKASSEPVTLEYSTENGTAIAGVDYVATSGSIRFEPGEITKWITVPIIGEVAADPDEDANLPANMNLWIKIKKIGAFIKKNQSTLINILKNYMLLSSLNTGNGSAYEVLFEYKGYTSEGPELKDCNIRNGRVYLYGILQGHENVGRTDDVGYTGNLWMNINMDICSVERDDRKDPPDQFCHMSVAGFGYVTTDLKMDSLDSKDYINIDCDTSKFYRNVVGDCFSQLSGERENVPNNSIASIFNGLELGMLVDAATAHELGQLRTLRKGEYSHIDEGGNVITLRVLRKIR